MKCPKGNCDWEGTPNLEEVPPHTKATCPECGSYIKFVSAKELDEIVKQTKIIDRTMSKSMMRRLVIQKGTRDESK